MKILIVVDMQNDFITGPLGTPEAQLIVPLVKNKIEEYREKDWVIAFTQDTHGADYFNTQEGKKLPVIHTIQYNSGWAVCDKLMEVACEEDLFIEKPTFGFVHWDAVFAQLEEQYGEEIEAIELVGVCTSICVISNAIILKAFMPEIPIAVDAKCCACVTPETHAAAITAMKTCQIDII